MLAQCCCSACVDMFGARGCRCCLTDLDRRFGALVAERTEATKPGPDPTGESVAASSPPLPLKLLRESMADFEV
jgi:hypothetical protein